MTTEPESTQAVPDFNSDKLPAASAQYVAWIDVMGARSVMARSLAISANFIFKLHAAAARHAKSEAGIRVYPIMDGVFVSSPSRDSIHRYIAKTFSTLAHLFIGTSGHEHRFMIRGALAYGPIVHGADVPHDACPEIANSPNHFEALLLGMPVVQAYAAEQQAPPFGVFLHESARAFSPVNEKPFVQVWLPWYRHSDAGAVGQSLAAKLSEYFAWCNERTGWLDYAPEALARHRGIAEQFFRYIA